MIKSYKQYINEDIKSKTIYTEVKCDNLKQLYPKIQVQYNDDFKIVISHNMGLKLNKVFYETLEKDRINRNDIVFENCEKISLWADAGFTSIKEYGVFGENIKDFYCAERKNLTSLEGTPNEVSGNFICIDCKNLTSLEFTPEKVGGDFSCADCTNLQSLKFAPKKVGGSFECSGCKKLTSLDDSPETVGKYFYCYSCNPEFIELAKEKYGNKVRA